MQLYKFSCWHKFISLLPHRHPESISRRRHKHKLRGGAFIFQPVPGIKIRDNVPTTIGDEKSALVEDIINHTVNMN